MELTKEETYLIKLCRDFLNEDDRGCLITFIEDIAAGGEGALFEWIATHLQLEQEMNKSRSRLKKEKTSKS